MNKCRSCGKEILWLKTDSGKYIPVDADSVAEYDKMKGIITFNPQTMKIHFATCPHANGWRKNENKKETAEAYRRVMERDFWQIVQWTIEPHIASPILLFMPILASQLKSVEHHLRVLDELNDDLRSPTITVSVFKEKYERIEDAWAECERLQRAQRAQK